MKRRIKLLKIIAFVCSVVCLTVGLSGCRNSDDDLPIGKLPEYESGYFRYAVDTLPSGKQKAYWIGLTELGKEQTELIYPEEIDGYTVYGTGYMFSTGIMTITYHYSEGSKSENLEKVFMPVLPKENIGYYLSEQVILWDSSYCLERIKWLGPIDWEIKAYGYNIYIREGRLLLQRNISFLIANVTYLYNYDNETNDGYYWADTYDEGLITYIPPEPTREGYTFGGWYKEADCINAWDFETDRTGKEICIERDPYFYEDREPEYKEYDGIYLYAKWVANTDQ